MRRHRDAVCPTAQARAQDANSTRLLPEVFDAVESGRASGALIENLRGHPP